MLIVSLESLTKTNSCILRASDPVSLSTFWLISEISLCVAAGLDVSHLTRAAVNLACRYVSGLIYQPPLLSRSPPSPIPFLPPPVLSLLLFSTSICDFACGFALSPIRFSLTKPWQAGDGNFNPGSSRKAWENECVVLCVFRVCNLCNSFTKKQRSEKTDLSFKRGHLNTLIHSFTPSVR